MLIRAHTLQKGFSLIELMVAVAVLGTLMAYALPSYQLWIQNAKVRTTSESLQNGLQLARAESVKQNAPVQFSLGTDSDWTVGCITVTAACPAVIQSHSAEEGSSSNIVVAPTPNNGNQITFNSFGFNSNTANTFTQLDMSSSTGDRPLRIIISAGGTTKMCDPSTFLASTDPRKCT